MKGCLALLRRAVWLSGFIGYTHGADTEATAVYSSNFQNGAAAHWTPTRIETGRRETVAPFSRSVWQTNRAPFCSWTICRRTASCACVSRFSCLTPSPGTQTRTTPISGASASEAARCWCGRPSTRTMPRRPVNIGRLFPMIFPAIIRPPPARRSAVRSAFAMKVKAEPPFRKRTSFIISAWSSRTTATISNSASLPTLRKPCRKWAGASKM